MAKELKTHGDLQDRNNANAAALPGRDARLARDDKGAQQANARHVARQDASAVKPGMQKRIERPAYSGLKASDTVAGVLKRPKGR